VRARACAARCPAPGPSHSRADSTRRTDRSDASLCVRAACCSLCRTSAVLERLARPLGAGRDLGRRCCARRRRVSDRLCAATAPLSRVCASRAPSRSPALQARRCKPPPQLLDANRLRTCCTGGQKGVLRRSSRTPALRARPLRRSGGWHALAQAPVERRPARGLPAFLPPARTHERATALGHLIACAGAGPAIPSASADAEKGTGAAAQER
jgi:hypothetical protein